MIAVARASKTSRRATTALATLAALVPLAACSAAPTDNASSSAAASTRVVTDPIFSKCTSPVSLTTHGGGSMAGRTVMLVPVFWGSAVTSTTPAAIESFYGILADSETPYLSWLASEYGTAPVGVDRSVTIAPSGYSTTSPQTVNDAQFQAELTNQLELGALSYNANAIYLIHLPKNVTAIDGAGDVQCTNWCAYHFAYSSPYGVVHYAIMPDPTFPNPCGPALCPQLTVVESHEIAESLTDPDGATGWRDYTQPAACGGEIGDICTTDQTTIVDPYGNSATVQKLWSNAVQDCVTAAQLPEIRTITPAVGSNVGGTQLQITGARFAVGSNATTFTFGGAPAPSSYCPSSTSCVVTTPPFLAPGASKVQVLATVGANTSAWDGPQDNYTFSAGSQCTSTLSCAGITWGFPDVIVTCNASSIFSYGSSPGEVPLGSGTTVTYRTDDVPAVIWACDPSRGSCSQYSAYESNASYCGSEPNQPPNFCKQCEAQGGYCGTIGKRHTCVFQ